MFTEDAVAVIECVKIHLLETCGENQYTNYFHTIMLVNK